MILAPIMRQSVASDASLTCDGNNRGFPVGYCPGRPEKGCAPASSMECRWRVGLRNRPQSLDASASTPSTSSTEGSVTSLWQRFRETSMTSKLETQKLNHRLAGSLALCAGSTFLNEAFLVDEKNRVSLDDHEIGVWLASLSGTEHLSPSGQYPCHRSPRQDSCLTRRMTEVIR